MKLKKILAGSVSAAMALSWLVQPYYALNDIGSSGEVTDYYYTELSDGTICLDFYKGFYIGKGGDIVIPSEISGKKVTEIGDWAFWNCTSLTSVTISDSVTKIGDRSFIGCDSLSSVDIPDNVTEIERGAFSLCDRLTSINVDEKNPNYCSKDGILFTKDMKKLIQYPAGKKDKTYFIPNTITKIGDFAFMGCQSLTSMTIPDGVTEIGAGAFDKCVALTSVTIPNSLTEIGATAFFGCTSLTSVAISDSVIKIGERSFIHCTSLSSVIIPNSVTVIDDNAFSDCSDDLTIYGIIGSYAETYANENNINFIGLKPVDSNDSNHGVEALAPESVPETAVLNVKIILSVGESVTYDISLTVNGKDVDLKGEKVLVKIPIPAGKDITKYKVYRKESGGKYTDMKATLSVGYLVFFTDHFSEYIVTTEDLAPKGKLGDLNSDGKVTIIDARWLLQAASGSRELTDEQKAVADINGDGKITIIDARWLLQVASGSREL